MDIAKLFGMPVNAAAHGARIDNTMYLIHILMAILFVGWGAFYVYCLMRFNKSKNPKADYRGVKSHFSSWLEGGVAIVEALFLIALAFPIWADVKAKPPAESEADVVVRVVGQQFAWNVHYMGADGKFGRRDIKLISDENVLGLDRTDPDAKDDITTINQMNLPIDKLVLVKLTTQDVIHGFALNEMRVKQDAIPGMEIPVYFKPIATGDWEIACAQLCGLGHYRMRGQLHIQTEADYQAWLAAEAPKPEEMEAPADAAPDSARESSLGAAPDSTHDAAPADSSSH